MSSVKTRLTLTNSFAIALVTEDSPLMAKLALIVVSALLGQGVKSDAFVEAWSSFSLSGVTCRMVGIGQC
jgi:hypothetical protein